MGSGLLYRNVISNYVKLKSYKVRFTKSDSSTLISQNKASPVTGEFNITVESATVPLYSVTQGHVRLQEGAGTGSEILINKLWQIDKVAFCKLQNNPI